MSVTMQPVDHMASAELISLLEAADRLAGTAGRADLVERLTRARAQVAGRQLRVAVVGPPGQGATSLVYALEQAPVERRPGATFLDVPGRPNQPRVPEPGSADVALFVTDAGHEYGPRELDTLARIRAQGLPVAGVISKIDAYPRWAEIQRANRHRLQAANLDSPSIPLLPVSAALCEDGRQRGDESSVVASGVPQLLEFLGDRISTRVNPALRDAVFTDVRAAVDQLAQTWNSELDALLGAGESSQDRQRRAMAELDRRQQLSALWQIALNDGATELMAQVDFDLRDRLREVMELAEREITKSNPARRWRQIDESLRASVRESVNTSFQLARDRSQRLGEKVAATLAGNQDGSPNGVALPRVRVANPDEALGRIKPMDPPETGGLFARFVNSLRGAYGGILMVGVLTSLAGLSLISIWSVAAGLLLGAFTCWEDLKNGRERGKVEAKLAVSKLMDSVNFRVGDELRTQLRAMHRGMRDHFTMINDQRLRAASDAVRATMDAGQLSDSQRDARLSELQNYLAELRQLRIRATVPRR